MKRYLAVFILPALCLCLTVGAEAAHGATVNVGCFPSPDWGPAPKADLPCTTITAPDNDQVRVIQGTATHELAECVVDIADMSDARCHRVVGSRAAPRDVAPAFGHPRPVFACQPQTTLCSYAGRAQEDGSVSILVFDLKHHPFRPLVECEFGNPAEESGRFTYPCRIGR